MSDRTVRDLPIARLEWLFSPRGLPLIDKGAPRPTTSLAVLGDAGAGKTTLAVGVAHAIARDLGGLALYITTELASTELGYKLAFLGLGSAQIVRAETPEKGRPGDLVAQHLALLHDPAPAAAMATRALEAALDTTSRAPDGNLPICCVVVDAFPLPLAGTAREGDREDVVGLMQTLEGRGVSVIFVEEDGGLQDYLPFIVDVVLDLRFAREHGTGELSRQIACKKSRYGRSFAGPHDAGTDAGKPAVWPNPLAVLGDDRNLVRTVPPAPFFLPHNARDVVVMFDRQTILLSPFDAASPLACLLRATPGLRVLWVHCGPMTFLAHDEQRVGVGEWEGAYALGWAILESCRAWACNTVLFQDLEALLHHYRFQRRIENVIVALRGAGLTVCVHGDGKGLRAIQPLADYVWEGKFGVTRQKLGRPEHRCAVDWLALDAWPVTVAPNSAAGREDMTCMRGALREVYDLTIGGELATVKEALESTRFSTDETASKVARAQFAVGKHVLGGTRSAESWLGVEKDEPAELSTSRAWAAAITGSAWLAAKHLIRQLPAGTWDESAELLWAGLVSAYAGNDAGLEHIQAASERTPAVVPLLMRSLARRRRWSDVDRLVDDLFARHRLPDFLRARMRAEARLEIDDETARAEAERYLEDLAVTIADFPSVHAADTWHNLGVARFRRGATEAARECWTRAVALNPGLDTAADLLERTATLGTPR